MKSNILTIMKKEFSKFFGDKRLVFTTLLLPGLMIFLMYSLMGDAIKSFTSVDDTYVYHVYVSNLPDSIKEDISSLNFDIQETDEKDIDTVKTQIMDKNADMLVIFPDGFDADVKAYDSSDASQILPNVDVYYNSTSTESANAYSLMLGVLDDYESQLANRFDVNSSDKAYDLASEKDVTGEFFSMMLPMLMMIFMFSGCMGIAPESIAGEKERGTIATLLVTPIKRSELAIGKIFSLSALALLSGLSSFLGTMLALPKLMGGEGMGGAGMSAAVYSIADYALLLVVILSTILLFISLISVISAFAKTTKEAATSVMPLMIIVMLIGVSAMFGNGAPTDTAWYLVPIYNSVQCMVGIFSFAYNPMHIIVTMAVNLAISGLFMYVLARMFNSEKVMFSL